jgi:hypothetical protein
MSDSPTILFRTPQAALVFAFNYSMQQQDRPLMDRLASPAARTGKGLSGVDGAGQAGMIRRLLNAGMEIESEGPISNEEAERIAQDSDAHRADLIGWELKALTVFERAALVARFAPHSMPCSCGRRCCCGYTLNPEWDSAIRVLEQGAMKVLAGHLSHYLLRRKIVEKIFGEKVVLDRIAEKCGASKNTATAHHKAIKLWISGQKAQHGKGGKEAIAAIDGIESSARKKIDTALTTLGFVGTAE